MLFAKDFKTAVAVVIAVAGLLGFGTANADVLLSEDGGAAASRPAFFAAEMYPGLWPTAAKDGGGQPIATSTQTNSMYVEVGDLNAAGTSGGIDTPLFDGDRYYIRFDFMGGAKFGTGWLGEIFVRYGPDTGQLRTKVQRVRGGQTGDAYGIWTFDVDTGQSDDSSNAAQATFSVDRIQASGEWTVILTSIRYEGVRFPRERFLEDTCFKIRFTVYDDGGSARGGTNELYEADGTLACFIPTVSARVAGAQTLTASVAEGFRKFTGDSPTMGTLATATVGVARTKACGGACPNGRTTMLPIQPPTDTEAFMDSDVLEEVEINLTGSFTHSSPFGFGEFKLGPTTMTRLDEDGEEIEADALKTAAGKAMTESLMATVEAAGVLPITVNVAGNVAAADGSYAYEAIGQGVYKAAWDIDVVGTGPNPEGGSDVTAGTIMRDGTSVRIGYLQTVTELERDGATIGWNQRLVITNHGTIAADVTLGDFKAAGDAEVMCKAADPMNPMHMMDGEPMWTCGDDGEVMTTIAGNSQLVLRVADVIMGASRAAGTITIAQDTSQISIASTHVTLPGGQTDTVRYWPLQ